MTEWYYVDNLRQRQGPVPQEALVKLHRSGALLLLPPDHVLQRRNLRTLALVRRPSRRPDPA